MGSNLGTVEPPVTRDDINTAWAVIYEMSERPAQLRCRPNEDLEIAAQSLHRIVRRLERLCDIATIVD